MTDDTVTFIPVWDYPYTVKYAVRIYGIKQDEDENGRKIGLTFGPAGGYGDSDKGEHTYVYCGDGTSGINKNEKYKSCGDDDPTCLHNMTWEQIVEVAKTHPESFEKCMYNRCTKAVPFYITGPLVGDSYAGQMDDCDGASCLTSGALASAYRKYNDTNTTVGGWRDSKMRNTLTGATSAEIIAHGGTLTEEESLYAMLPQVLKDNIVPKKVISATSDSKLSELAITYDTLWLFSTVELYKPGGYEYYSSCRDNREGKLYQSQEYLDAVGTHGVGSTMVNRFYDESGGGYAPWARSLSGGTYAVILDHVIGYPGNGSTSNTYGLAPGFCLG